MSSRDESILSAWGEFFLAHALTLKAIEDDIASKAPLSLSEYDVLLTISRAPESRARFSALADAAVFTRSGITRLSKRLEERGYLRRAECPHDKRGSYAELTDEGKKALKETWKHYRAAILKVFGGPLSHGDAREVEAALKKVVSSLLPEPLIQIGK